MKLSIFYARVLGFYLVIMTVGMFVRSQPVLQMMSPNNQGLLTVLGFFTLILGLVMVMSHQVWRGWPILITILGYWAVVKGIVLVFYPDWMLQFAATVLQEKNLMIGLGFDLALGFILLGCGFISKRH